MATEIPPHNLGKFERVDQIIDQPDVSVDELIELIPARLPHGRHHLWPPGYLRRLRTGRGKITLRARAEINEEAAATRSSLQSAVPCKRVNRLAEAIGELVKDERHQGQIRPLRDESSARGGEPVRLCSDLTARCRPQLVLTALPGLAVTNALLQSSCSALVDGRRVL